MPRWTPETRIKQASAIRGWMPWTLSTGPVTAEGKARCSRNAWKGGVRAKVSNWHRTVSQIVLNVEKLYSLIRPKRKKHRLAGPAPLPSVSSPALTWNFAIEEEEDGDDDDDDEKPDAVDRMSSAEVQAALIRLGAWKPPSAGQMLAWERRSEPAQ